MTCHDVGRRLDAYVDDELDPIERTSVADHIDGCPACRQRLARLESLGRLVRGMPYYPAPDQLRTAVTSAPGRGRDTPRVLAWAAAVTLVASLGGASAVRSWQTARATSLMAQEVVNQHVRGLGADHLVDVRSSNQHTVKPWFQGKLDFSPPVADLASAGFALIGGRVDTLAGRPVAALVYQRREHLIHVFVWPISDRTATSDARTIRGFQERHWVHGGMSVWAASDLNDREMDEFARLLQSSTP
jgi:anti-sigma factor RsiW